MSRSHWNEAAKIWQQIGEPLKPPGEALQHYAEAVSLWQGLEPRVLLMGVTQELFAFPWPSGTSISALDNSADMIKNVWLGPPEAAFLGDWRDMPLTDGSFDLAVCDGGLTLLPYPEGHLQVSRELSRILAENGLCVFRLHICPAAREEPAQVFAALAGGEIPDISHFKLRIAAAMQTDPESGVVLADIWDALIRFAPDLDALAESIGWPIEHMRSIETYRGSANVYRFMTLEQIESVFPEFHLERVWRPTNPLQRMCPVAAFRKRT
ncbi:MAG TPA: class I SAM-dependent methyltransferase [Fimbriimonas sp.]|nr:class I SAM-dependent methyltransferase [Fimbriimonas sp.]